MFYIVESEKQLERLEKQGLLGQCYVEVVTSNDNVHPALSTVVAVYIRPLVVSLDESGEEIGWEPGYIIPVDHNEGLCVEMTRVQEILSKFQTIYTLDKKQSLYFIKHSNIQDLNLIWLLNQGQKLEYLVREKTYNWYYNRYGGREDINKIIPLSKIYERCENTFEQIKEVFDCDVNPLGFKFYNDLVTPVFYLIEKEGIRVDTHEFEERFHPTNPVYSIKGETVYTRYNLYNITGRPTNSFNSVNFLAIPKGQEFRRCFKPKNDEFVQMDFDGYHVRLVANSIGFEIPNNIKAHKYLASLYYKKGVEDLTKEEYKAAKQVNFQSIYGTIPEEYKHLEFFELLKDWVDDNWERFEEEGGLQDPISKRMFEPYKLSEMKPTKLTNYYIQGLETSRNTQKLFKVLKYLEGRKTKVLLVTYDSVLLDYAKEDGQEVLDEIQKILENGKFPVSVDKSLDLNFS